MDGEGAERSGVPEPPLTPWDALADAYERLDDSRRHGTPEEVAAALADADLADDATAALGTLLMVKALKRGGLPLQKHLAEAFDALSRVAYDRATKAGRRATWACDEIVALRNEVKGLREEVARLTPGVGRPGE